MRMIGVDQRPEKVRRGTVIASLDLDSVEDRIKIPLVSMGGSVEGQACADPVAAPIGDIKICVHIARENGPCTSVQRLEKQPYNCSKQSVCFTSLYKIAVVG